MKLLVSDYDGTIKPYDKNPNFIEKLIFKENIKSINDFMKNNKFVIATGRNTKSISDETEKYEIKYDYLISYNGRVIVDNNNNVINVPGCPIHPIWLIGTIGYILNFGTPSLDKEQRPITFFGRTIHDDCPRRHYFDDQIFARKYGDKECMFALGCRGPITKADCPLIRWNESDNWPIGNNTTCIGCARQGFPDDMEPFVRY